MIQELINRPDSVEIVRDKIAQILKNESANQEALAEAEGLDGKDWRLKVYTERTSPWESLLGTEPDTTPIVNVWFDNDNFQEGGSNSVEQQLASGIFNIDCIGSGIAKSISGGHEAADKKAAFEAMRAIRLVRNIIMAGAYTYLDLRKLVGGRWPQSRSAFRIQSENGSIQKCMGMRLALRVTYLEFSPQIQPEILTQVSTSINRAEDGEVLADADYQYPLGE